jgi:hypothetical protein
LQAESSSQGWLGQKTTRNQPKSPDETGLYVSASDAKSVPEIKLCQRLVGFIGVKEDLAGMRLLCHPWHRRQDDLASGGFHGTAQSLQQAFGGKLVGFHPSLQRRFSTDQIRQLIELRPQCGVIDRVTKPLAPWASST